MSGLNNFLKSFDKNNTEDKDKEPDINNKLGTSNEENRRTANNSHAENRDRETPVKNSRNIKIGINKKKPSAASSNTEIVSRDTNNNANDSRVSKKEYLNNNSRGEANRAPIEPRAPKREVPRQPEQRREVPRQERPKQAEPRQAAPRQDPKKDILSKDLIDRMFNESETKAEFKDEWVETYMKGVRSRKKNATVRKILSGRFRIMSGGKMEILPELKTHNMTSMDILNTDWLKK